MAKKKFYAVKKGYAPGIYSTWPAAEAQVKGFAGAQFKGFVSEGEARSWLEGDGTSLKKREKKPENHFDVQDPVSQDADVIIYTDGGAINNPGPGGYGVVLTGDGTHRELHGGFRLTTNNRMELMACIMALREVRGISGKIVLYSDSSYVVNGISKGWVKNWQRNGWIKSDKKPVMNRDLWEELIELSVDLDIHFRWVKGHAGNPLNERCDKLAVRSAKGANLPIDIEYERSAGK